MAQEKTNAAEPLVTSSPSSPTKEQLSKSGLKIKYLATPIEGLMVGGQPKKGDIPKIKDLGFETIISLNPEPSSRRLKRFDEAYTAETLGMKFIRIPIHSNKDLNDKNIALLDEALSAAGGKAFVHCSDGNRVGAMLALRAFRMQNISVDESIEFGKKALLRKGLLRRIEKDMRRQEAAKANQNEE